MLSIVEAFLDFSVRTSQRSLTSFEMTDYYFFVIPSGSEESLSPMKVVRRQTEPLPNFLGLLKFCDPEPRRACISVVESAPLRCSRCNGQSDTWPPYHPESA